MILIVLFSHRDFATAFLLTIVNDNPLLMIVNGDTLLTNVNDDPLSTIVKKEKRREETETHNLVVLKKI